MKNIKLIAMTVVLIALSAACVLGMSDNVESFWQQTGETPNSISVSPDKFVNINTTINYPFIRLDETEDEEQLKFYGHNLISARIPPENTLTYQQVANIMGESLSILFGLKTQETAPATIQYQNIEEEISYPVSERYFYSYIVERAEDIKDTNNYKVINCLINPYTGEIWSLQTFGNIHNLYDQSIADGSTIHARTDVTKLPSQVHARIAEAAAEYRALMFVEGDIVSTEIVSMRVDQARNCYNVRLNLSNGNVMDQIISSINNTDFYLEAVTVYKPAIEGEQ